MKEMVVFIGFLVFLSRALDMDSLRGELERWYSIKSWLDFRDFHWLFGIS